MGIIALLFYLVISLVLKILPIVLIFFIIAKIAIKLFGKENFTSSSDSVNSDDDDDFCFAAPCDFS